MTVVTASNKTFKVGDGVTTDIPYSFRIFADTDFRVLQTNLSTGEVTTLVLNTDYTVEGAGGYNGGKVIETVAAPVGIKTTIIRIRPALQKTDLRNQGAYFAEVHEDVFDDLCMVDQQQQEVLARSLVFSADVFPDDFNTELPSAIVGSPGATVMVNAAGDGFVRGPDASEITSGGASAAASALAAANSASSASDSLDATIIKAGEASDSADEAAASAASINPANLAHLANDEVITGNWKMPADFKWQCIPIGGYYEVNTALTGVEVPPTTNPLFRYIRLAAGLTGVGGYNNGCLSSESVTGSAPLVIATAVVSLSGSPMNGTTIDLLNTESRMLRAGTSAGTKLQDALQNITGTIIPTIDYPDGTGAFAPGTARPSFRPGSDSASVRTLLFDASLVARTATETRPKTVTVTVYQRIK